MKAELRGIHHTGTRLFEIHVTVSVHECMTDGGSIPANAQDITREHRRDIMRVMWELERRIYMEEAMTDQERAIIDLWARLTAAKQTEGGAVVSEPDEDEDYEPDERVTCEACTGYGWIDPGDGREEAECPQCNGEGVVKW